MDAPRGRDLQGRCIAPDPKAERNKLRASRSDDFLAGSPGGQGGGGEPPWHVHR
ncbi:MULTISPECIES: hypothetical protein [unclassified Enterobacter]|uniref:hypothetical protein n=1 Tax=unclassified Enterobacter TaxID=2608935 RepID=UPI0015EACE50|nr:hypothetical protein [Enterobacter sp. RHBSTW-00175]HDR2752977.1 hypothetical protein [Enterobacter asburiae]QMR76866.1 hypothetical protein HV107_15190 [Enterobacter sp. RHBSTW-00175]HDR2787756.1 hypothetical protein [Enterobacter asburiae]HDR2794478.1 hypothetical protein [Enterobacter asburiae]HDR2799720.1 hypothetical protein [Enterobacter asburiae]